MPEPLEIITIPADNNHSERMGYTDIDLYPMQEQLLEQMVEDFNDQEETFTTHTSSEIQDSGVFYAPYIPLYQTPTVHISEIMGPRFYTGWKSKTVNFSIPKYNDIYSDIMNRFEIMDL